MNTLMVLTVVVLVLMIIGFMIYEGRQWNLLIKNFKKGLDEILLRMMDKK
jgi:hypothetical protein